MVVDREQASTSRTGGIDICDDFRPRVEGELSNNLYCVSVPFLLHKLPFVQGITSAHEMGAKVATSIIASLEGDGLLASEAMAHVSAQPSTPVSP